MTFSMNCGTIHNLVQRASLLQLPQGNTDSAGYNIRCCGIFGVVLGKKVNLV